MRKMFLISTIVFLCGCTSSFFPSRGQIRPGMTKSQIVALYILDPNDPDPLKYMPQPEIVSEETTGECIIRTRRYWLMQPHDVGKIFAKPTPFLLTFKLHKLSEEEVKSKWTAKQQFVEKFCKENNISDPEDRQIVEVLFTSPDFGYGTPVLVKIDLDEDYLLRRTVRKAAADRRFNHMQHQLQRGW